MMPVLLSFGSVHIFSLSIALVCAWCVFSFLFWQALRDTGAVEEHIFDLTFYSTIVAFLAARAGYVLFNLSLFQKDPLRIAALWITPGLSLYGALIGGLVICVFLSRSYKIRMGHVLDALAKSLAPALIVGFIGVFLDGSYVGVPAKIPWAVRYVGHLGLRHPVALYECIALFIVFLLMVFITKKGKEKKWAYGVVGLWFFALFTIFEFTLEFFKDTHVYLGYLRANQWVLIALFAETMGAFYVRGGGREWVRPGINKIIGGIHDKFSKRRS